MTKVLITGGTGLIGNRLIDRFDDALVTTRNVSAARKKLGDKAKAIQWDSYNQPLDLSGCGKIDAVINLMGESIASGRWNAEKKKRILDSRVVGTQRLVEAISKLPEKPECLISASAVGYYGDMGDQEIDENSSAGTGFLSDVCEQWEAAAANAAQYGIRLVYVRIGIVLTPEGGALAEMLPIFRKGLGGRLGSGKQYFPWIHIDDLVGLIHWMVQNPVSGAFNGVAPNSVTNAEFTKTLASVINRPALFPVPKFVLKIVVGELANSLFESQRVIPSAALDAGFEFEFKELQPALVDLLVKS